MLENLRLSERYDGFIFLAESARNPPILKPHHHQELELNVVRRGEITYVVRGQRYRFGQRSLLWMYPAQEHQLVDRTDDAEYYVAVFKPQLIADACRSSLYEGLKRENFDDGVLHTVLEPESFDLMRKTMDAALEGSLDADVLNREGGFGVNSSDFRFEHGDPDALNAGLRYILLLCWRCQRAGKAVNHAVSLHPAVQRALTLLREPEGGENLARLARACGVSEAYLSRIFARQVGVPLNRYRNSVRLARFWKVYHTPPQKTLTEAVYAAGFGSYAQFYKVFTHSYGRGPRASLALR